MKAIQEWNGREWVDSSIDKLLPGVHTIKVVEREVPALDYDNAFYKHLKEKEDEK